MPGTMGSHPGGGLEREPTMSIAAYTRFALAPLLVAACIVLAGCEEKVTQANYEQIQVGMTKLEVERLLGSGEDATSAAGSDISSGGLMSSGDTPDEVWVWESDGAEIVVTFVDGKVALKRQEGLD